MANQPITSYQPIKAVFVAANLLYCLLLRFPILGLYFLSASNRQDPTWSWKQAIGISFGRFLFNMASSARFAREFPVEKSPKDPKQVHISAIAQDKLRGVLSDPKVTPMDVMGVWYPARFDATKDIASNTKVILFMFGGAYVMGEPNPANYTKTLKDLCPGLNAKFLTIGYRLAGSSGGQPFPAQLQDLFSAYQHLLDMGVSSKNIILAGESAGGNAVISFLRFLEDSAPENQILFPSAALLSSPWVDLTPDPWLRPKNAHYKTDFAAVNLVVWGQQAFVPSNRTVSDIWISPALKPFRSRVPLWIEAGTEEVAFDAIQAYASDMEQAGSDVGFFGVQHGTHAPMWAAGMVGFDPKPSIESFVGFMKERNL